MLRVGKESTYLGKPLLKTKKKAAEEDVKQFIYREHTLMLRVETIR